MTAKIVETVRTQYGAVAVSGLSSAQAGVRSVAEAFGYSPEELSSIPAESNLGLSCGNPTAMASLAPGEVVIDLGCGGGLDVFLAAQKVGPTGKAIGVDMTAEMIALARKNAAARPEFSANTEFHLANIDSIPVADGSVDCVISNCVINLAPDKPAVFREMVRVLRPGGRVAISDIALKRALPEEIAGDVAAFVGCIAGALPIEDYRRGLIEAGFCDVEIIDSGADLNAYASVENQSGCCSPAMATGGGAIEGDDGLQLPIVPISQELPVEETTNSACRSDEGLHTQLTRLLQQHNINDYAASVKIYAVRPA